MHEHDGGAFALNRRRLDDVDRAAAEVDEMPDRRIAPLDSPRLGQGKKEQSGDGGAA